MRRMLAIEIYRWPISDCNGYLLEVSASGGQGIIEYVLIIVVISLVIVFAGPGVAGDIRNQFNLVGNTVNNGTVGGVEGGASGGGSAGTDSATVQAAIAKDAKDWTLDEQEAVAEDVAAKGEASPACAKAKAAMDAAAVIVRPGSHLVRVFMQGTPDPMAGQIADQYGQRLCWQDVPGSAMTADGGRMDHGQLTTQALHALQNLEVRFQLAAFIATHPAVNDWPIGARRKAQIDPDALQMRMIFQHEPP